MNQPPVILFGVGGGISAYKAAEVVSRAARDGAEVHVAMTAAAQEFVTPTTFASLSRRRVLTCMFPPAGSTDGDDLFPHLYPATRADVFVLVPATADLMAKVAAGIGDDVVCASALALPASCLRVFCPAMNTHMWRQPVVQANVRRLEEAGWIRVGPSSGSLACGTSGEGRMAEPAEILDALRAAQAAAGSLAGRRVLVLSGPTREPLDDVRHLSNASSGRMGAAVAAEAARRGAEVDFVTGPVDESRLPQGPRIRVHRVVRAAEMLAKAEELAPAADVAVFAAAVADYAPARPAAGKPAKQAGRKTLELKPTPDIAAALGRAKRPAQVFIGFALESNGGRARAEAKRAAKRFDGIVLNGMASMGAEAAAFEFLDRDGRWSDWGRIGKAECARRLLDAAAEFWGPGAR